MVTRSYAPRQVADGARLASLLYSFVRSDAWSKSDMVFHGLADGLCAPPPPPRLAHARDTPAPYVCSGASLSNSGHELVGMSSSPEVKGKVKAPLQSWDVFSTNKDTNPLASVKSRSWSLGGLALAPPRWLRAARAWPQVHGVLQRAQLHAPRARRRGGGRHPLGPVWPRRHQRCGGRRARPWHRRQARPAVLRRGGGRLRIVALYYRSSISYQIC
jgi:hypothetical protein